MMEEIIASNKAFVRLVKLLDKRLPGLADELAQQLQDVDAKSKETDAEMAESLMLLVNELRSDDAT